MAVAFLSSFALMSAPADTCFHVCDSTSPCTLHSGFLVVPRVEVRHICLYLRMFIYMPNMYICLHVYIHAIHAFMYVCIYIHTYIYPGFLIVRRVDVRSGRHLLSPLRVKRQGPSGTCKATKFLPKAGLFFSWESLSWGSLSWEPLSPVYVKRLSLSPGYV